MRDDEPLGPDSMLEVGTLGERQGIWANGDETTSEVHERGSDLQAFVAESERGAIYLDSPFARTGGDDPAETRPHYERIVDGRTLEQLRVDRPQWSERDRVIEARAASRFDIDTAVALDAGPGGSWPPRTPPRSLIVRAEPLR